MTIFVLSCTFLMIFGAMYILSESNITFSTFGIRRKTDLEEYENHRYYNWYLEKEEALMELYAQEYCEDMQFAFDQFCLAIYNELKIIYT